jgi:hypothetical protein
MSNYPTEQFVFQVPKGDYPGRGFSLPIKSKYHASWIRIRYITGGGGVYDVSNTVRVIGGSINVERRHLIPSLDLGSPFQNNFNPAELDQPADDWEVVFEATPFELEIESFGNLKLYFPNNTKRLRPLVTQIVEAFWSDIGALIPTEYRIYFIDKDETAENYDPHIGKLHQADLAGAIKQLEAGALQGYVTPDDLRITVETIGNYMAEQNLEQIVPRHIYNSDFGIRRNYSSMPDVGFAYIREDRPDAIHHELFHALHCGPESYNSNLWGSDSIDSYNEGKAVEQYKHWAGNPELTSIPSHNFHPLPANQGQSGPAGACPFVFIGGIPCPLPYGALSYAFGIMHSSLEAAVLEEQGARLGNDKLEQFAPEAGKYFENWLCNNVFYEFRTDYIIGGAWPARRVVSTDTKQEFAKAKQTKSYFLSRLMQWGFFEQVQRIHGSHTNPPVSIPSSVGSFYSAFESFYREEYDLPYSDKNSLEQTLGNVILFRGDSLDPSRSDDTAPNSGAISSSNYYGHNSKAVLEYAGFRTVEDTTTVMNGEILKKVESQNRIPYFKSATEHRKESLIVSELKCEDYDAQYGNTKDDIIRSYFGGRKRRHKLEVPNTDPSLPSSCEDYYIIIDDKPSEAFASYTFTSKFDNRQAPLIII